MNSMVFIFTFNYPIEIIRTNEELFHIDIQCVEMSVQRSTRDYC